MGAPSTSGTSHTPGPWAQTYSKNPQIVGTVSGKDIASTSARNVPLAQSEANARLIAAAPEMLEALQTLVESLTWEEKRSGTTYSGLEDARAAIAKATGTDRDGRGGGK